MSKIKNTSISVAEGTILGFLGMGLLDIPLFISVIMKTSCSIFVIIGFTPPATITSYSDAIAFILILIIRINSSINFIVEYLLLKLTEYEIFIGINVAPEYSTFLRNSSVSK